MPRTFSEESGQSLFASSFLLHLSVWHSFPQGMDRKFLECWSQDLPSVVVKSACLRQITKFIYGQFRGRLEGRLELVDLPCEREVLSHGMPQGTGPQPSTTCDVTSLLSSCLMAILVMLPFVKHLLQDRHCHNPTV